jgi:hypothetical protein
MNNKSKQLSNKFVEKQRHKQVSKGITDLLEIHKARTIFMTDERNKRNKHKFA